MVKLFQMLTPWTNVSGCTWMRVLTYRSRAKISLAITPTACHMTLLPPTLQHKGHTGVREGQDSGSKLVAGNDE